MGGWAERDMWVGGWVGGLPAEEVGEVLNVLEEPVAFYPSFF